MNEFNNINGTQEDVLAIKAALESHGCVSFNYEPGNGTCYRMTLVKKGLARGLGQAEGTIWGGTGTSVGWIMVVIENKTPGFFRVGGGPLVPEYVGEKMSLTGSLDSSNSCAHVVAKLISQVLDREPFWEE